MKRLGAPQTWLAALLVCFLILGVTGVWLTVRYRPDPPTFSTPRTLVSPVHGGGWVDDVHRVLAVTAVLAAAGLVLSCLKM